jgi:hypothetical protein
VTMARKGTGELVAQVFDTLSDTLLGGHRRTWVHGRGYGSPSPEYETVSRERERTGHSQIRVSPPHL